MASVVGHALGAVVIWEVGRRLPGDSVPRAARWYALPAVLAVLPDLDVVLLMALGPGTAGFHRGWSHSALVALLMAACAVVLVKACGGAAQHWRAFAVLAGCTLVHPLLDYLMGCGPPVRLLWPFVRHGWLSPVQLIPTAYYPLRPSGFLTVLTSSRTWAGVGLEIASLGCLWLAVRARSLWGLAWAAASAGAFTATLLLCN